MLYFKKHGKGLKCTLLLQWIVCAVLWSLSIAPVQAAGALWQNPYTGRIISLPDYISVKLYDDLIYINKIEKNHTVTSISLQGKAMELYPSAMQYPDSTSLLGYPILKKQKILPEQNSLRSMLREQFGM